LFLECASCSISPVISTIDPCTTAYNSSYAHRNFYYCPRIQAQSFFRYFRKPKRCSAR
jgi:hypothetical protein